MTFDCTITEQDESGHGRKIVLSDLNGKLVSSQAGHGHSTSTGQPRNRHVLNLATRVFLPSGYPHTVSPDYLRFGFPPKDLKIFAIESLLDRYQVFNALQAFCNSLASLLSSRAILEGHGIGDPTATATHALLLTILQDVLGRSTTIVSAHLLGSSLAPEAKKFRLLADILNDSATVLDILSPALNTSMFPGLRICALCISASFRALCGIVAGGSKAAITLHFATPLHGTGDIGDLNAKDSSKETVLALMGMLLGTLIVPNLTTPWSTYTTLFILIGLHLSINYVGVKGLVFRTLNRQRTWIAYSLYVTHKALQTPTPSMVNASESIFDRPSAFRKVDTGRFIGDTKMGSSLSEILQAPLPPRLMDIFEQEKYLIWFDDRVLFASGSPDAPKLRGYPQLHICFRVGFTFQDQIKAWVHAGEICSAISSATKLGANSSVDSDVDALTVIEQSYKLVLKEFSGFLKHLESLGWNIFDGALMSGSPAALLLSVEYSSTETQQEKKKIR